MYTYPFYYEYNILTFGEYWNIDPVIWRNFRRSQFLTFLCGTLPTKDLNKNSGKMIKEVKVLATIPNPPIMAGKQCSELRIRIWKKFL